MASSARFRIPVGARREQAARSASTSARVRGSAGNRRAAFRFTRHQTVLAHVQCRFLKFLTLYGGPYPPRRHGRKRNDTLSFSGNHRAMLRAFGLPAVEGRSLRLVAPQQAAGDPHPGRWGQQRVRRVPLRGAAAGDGDDAAPRRLSRRRIRRRRFGRPAVPPVLLGRVLHVAAFRPGLLVARLARLLRGTRPLPDILALVAPFHALRLGRRGDGV
jgi:hypothetical protein